MKNTSVLESRDGEGNTALLIACKHRHYEMIEFLISSGADVFAKNAKNQSALVLFVKGQRESFVAITDEFAAIASQGYVDALTKGRDLGIAAFVATQDYAGVVNAHRPEGRCFSAGSDKRRYERKKGYH